MNAARDNCNFISILFADKHNDRIPLDPMSWATDNNNIMARLVQRNSQIFLAQKLQSLSNIGKIGCNSFANADSIDVGKVIVL